MKPTDVKDPNYFHKVVDCQWACPAHTNVPEYIRLIAQGRYTDAYMVNRESNVFPAILGRTCDRPCEPACRRDRVDGTPVAICRLKRVAADLRDDISDRLPVIPSFKNGKRIACVGAGPASLTVANDLLPLGYDVTIFEQHATPGGLMRTNIPAFRLPADVLDEEIDVILEMGVDIRYNSPVSSLRGLMDEGYDAVFVGSGAPRGKELNLPGRHDTDRIHIGIDWLESIAFGHIDSVGERVLIIGVGNTAMDCCRSSRRLGGKDIKVMARRPRGFFKASPWELDDAEEEEVEILVNHAPKRFIVEDGTLVGMEFDRLEWDEKARNSTVIDTVVIPCDDVILAIGQENAFPVDRARSWHGVRRVGHASGRQDDLPVNGAGSFLWGRRGLGTGEHHLGGGARASGRHLDSQLLRWHSPDRASSRAHEPGQPEDGLDGVELSQRLQPGEPAEDDARRPYEAVPGFAYRGRAGVFPGADRARGPAVPELRHSNGL